MRARTSITAAGRGVPTAWYAPAMPRPSAQVVEIAKRGAEARLQDLLHEAQMLIELFPHLEASFDKDEL